MLEILLWNFRCLEYTLFIAELEGLNRNVNLWGLDDCVSVFVAEQSAQLEMEAALDSLHEAVWEAEKKPADKTSQEFSASLEN